MDDIHEEYTEYCHNNNKEAKFNRANLPNDYGGKVDLLLWYPTFLPTILFKSVTGIVLSKHPFLSPRGQKQLVVGGVLPNNFNNLPTALLTDVTNP